MKRDWAEGVWQLAIAHSGDEARALRELARKAGVTPASAEDSDKADAAETAGDSAPAPQAARATP